VPVRALAWCEAVCDARVVSATALDGGMSSAVHALALDDGRALVLRRYVREEWLAEEPDVPRREAIALEALPANPALAAPRLVAADPEGAQAGDPAVLMTRLPGAITWHPHDLDGFLRGLAALLPAIHATPPVSGIPAYVNWPPETDRPPAWTTRPEVWERAFAVFDAPLPVAEPVFLHRDFHPGNVLWEGDAVSGVIDWPNASVGHPHADIGYCRNNLAAALGLDVADRFLACCDAPGYSHYWDVVAALGGFDDEILSRWTPVEEEFLARAVARL
jgi:aminoglycoside phosphotransferase (APT) family kinase protein